MNANILKDMRSVLGSTMAVLNEGHSEYYAFAVHRNGKEIARGEFTRNLDYANDATQWNYYWELATDTVCKCTGKRVQD